MKILFVCPSLEAGGAERICLELLEKLDRTRFTPSLAVFSRSGRLAGMVAPDVPVFDMKKKKRTDVLRLVCSLAFRILPREKPDVVVGILWYANFICIIARLLSFHKPRIYIKECTSTRKSPDHHGAVRRLFFRLLYPMADRVIAISRGIGREVIADFHVPPDRVSVIHNGVDCVSVEKLSMHVVSPGDVFSRDKTKKIVACGRLSKEKNFPLLLAAFARLGAASDAELAIIGDGGEMARLVKEAERLGIRDRVNFPGFRHNPWMYMAKADVFVLSSLFEGFGNVIIEAMACGVAVISTDCDYGPAEIIENRKTGILVRSDDPAAMVLALGDAIGELLADDVLRKKLAAAGRQRAWDFDSRLMVKKYESIF
jgi:glycosyltransferase involved in cell wall biosynthesis